MCSCVYIHTCLGGPCAHVFTCLVICGPENHLGCHFSRKPSTLFLRQSLINLVLPIRLGDWLMSPSHLLVSASPELGLQTRHSVYLDGFRTQTHILYMQTKNFTVCAISPFYIKLILKFMSTNYSTANTHGPLSIVYFALLPGCVHNVNT